MIITPENEGMLAELRTRLPEGSFIHCVWIRSTKTSNEYKVFTDDWHILTETLGRLRIGTFIKGTLTMPDVIRMHNGGTARDIGHLLGHMLYGKEHNAILTVSY